MLRCSDSLSSFGDGIDPILAPGRFINRDCPSPKLSRFEMSCFLVSLLETLAAPILLESFMISPGDTLPRYVQSFTAIPSNL